MPWLISILRKMVIRKYKAISTMFPDDCTMDQVLNSIAYAYNTSNGGNPPTAPNQTFQGLSVPHVGEQGDYCTEQDNMFNIREFTSNSAVFPSGNATLHNPHSAS